MAFLEYYYIKQQNKLSQNFHNIETHFKSLLDNFEGEEKLFHFICYHSKKSLTIPARGNKCKHVEAYQMKDLMNLIKENLGCFQCFCGNNINLKDIYIDEYLKLLINTYPQIDIQNDYLLINKNTGNYEVRKMKTENKENLEKINQNYDMVFEMDLDDEYFSVKCFVDFSNNTKVVPISIFNISDHSFSNNKVSDKYLTIYSSLKNYLDNHFIFSGLVLRDIFTLINYIKSISVYSVFIIDLEYFLSNDNNIFLELFISFIIKINSVNNKKMNITFLNNDFLINNKDKLENMITKLSDNHNTSRISVNFISENEIFNLNKYILESDFLDVEIKDFDRYIEDLLKMEYNLEVFLKEPRISNTNLFEISLNKNEDNSFIITDKNLNYIGKELFFDFVNETLFYFNFGKYIYTNILLKSNFFSIPSSFIIVNVKDNIHTYLYSEPNNNYSFKHILSETFTNNSVIITNYENINNTNITFIVNKIMLFDLQIEDVSSELETKFTEINSNINNTYPGNEYITETVNSIILIDNQTIPENLDPNLYSSKIIDIIKELSDKNLYYFFVTYEQKNDNFKRIRRKENYLFIQRDYNYGEKEKLQVIIKEIINKSKKQNSFTINQLIQSNYTIKNRISYQKFSR